MSADAAGSAVEGAKTTSEPLCRAILCDGRGGWVKSTRSAVAREVDEIVARYLPEEIVSVNLTSALSLWPLPRIVYSALIVVTENPEGG